MNEEQQIEELNQQLTVLYDVKREAEENRPKYEVQISRFEDQIADALVDQILDAGVPEVFEGLMVEQAKYKEALRKALLIPGACERRIKAVEGEIRGQLRRIKRKERYESEKDRIEDLLKDGNFERACYYAGDLRQWAAECGMVADADEFLVQLNLKEKQRA